MKYRYERWIGGVVCHITVEFIDRMHPVTIIDSTFPHLIGLQYAALGLFEKQYPDYSMNNGGVINSITGSVTATPLPIPKSNPFLAWMDDFNNSKPKGIDNTMPMKCEHTFVSYIGIIETFEYCTKCDMKQKVS